jgi:sigma-B regulation protein RsbU (phosphoserine phosphatase)
MSKILIIDDDLSVRTLLQRSLEEQGYEVGLAKDGQEGIAMARSFQPSLIVCDWIMPQLDGLDVCRQVKADPDLSTTFFILLTSHANVEDRIRGLDTGADDFLSKPIELLELQARVRAGLRLQRVNQDLQTQKQVLEKEFAEAADYVRSLLPAPMQGAVQIDSRFIPSRQLGGDCFDYYWLDPDYLAIYLLDVSGHGLGSALPSIAVLNLLRSQSMDGVNFYQPSHVLRALNETFQMDGQNDKYFTIWYGVYNRVKRQLSYASAGHPPSVLVIPTPTEEVEAKQLRTSGFPIGMLPDARFSSQRCEIPQNSSLYIFSDGVYEIMQSDGKIWGLDSFVQMLRQSQAAIAEKGLDLIIDHLKQLNLKDSFEDDVSLLQVQFD